MKSLGKALRTCAFAVLAGSLFPALTATAAEKEAPKDIVLTGDAKCTTCHDENDSPEALRIGKTKHGTVADKRTPGCTNCHGESEKHVKEAGRGSGPTPPVDVGFTKKNKTTSAEAQNASCLSCHQGSTRIFWQNSTHARRDVTCVSCHTIHDGHDKVREAKSQPEVCSNCHKEQRAQFARPSHHPVPEGQMSCSSCHNVHGDNPSQLQKSSVNDTCYSCHMEKRGPFVHNHQPVSEDCAICHNPHGTNVANLLKARAPYLCQECHSHDSHPSQLAGLPTGRTASTDLLGTVGRGCLNCHTNIHGGNSTVNSATAGRFRR
ncbi:DmsE family decaheme c-type cytochrome [Aromatoleum petrolei]|uniref:DmsE family decaheme c-type cytochrome n=1 Tax=Aromatoleum petrolei TaxID=76116 RepID=A0ABX1MSZ0_9RHOO|nr:DmsE family decaheme c-type cytochrome [Aromatoleum petrolei]NMF89109.1 DmsE family decaheme c-type cytochrome [Aromatoleum petrolei]